MVQSKKFARNIGALLLALALMLGLALPAHAAWRLRPDTLYSNSLYLNIYGREGSLLQKRVITLYNTSSPNRDQIFELVKLRRGDKTGYLLCASEDNRYAINRRTSDGRAWLWPYVADEDFRDAAMTKPVPNPSSPFTMIYHPGIGLGYSQAVNGASVWLNSGSSSWLISGEPTLPMP